ncbi:MAG TPA: hypothetical protein PLB95_00645 [Syntrophales bacterium]|jgi:transcription antitermination factor NusA-like protein|nr:hypothetical protein [Syntrophales bacterium]
MYLKIGHLVPATVIKAMPDHDSYLMAIANSEIMALLAKENAGKTMQVGDCTAAVVHAFKGERVLLTQQTAVFYRRLVEMLLSPLLMEGKVKVCHAAAIRGAGFAKVSIEGLNGCNPIQESMVYIHDAKEYTSSTITMVAYSHDKIEYIKNSLIPASRDHIQKVIYDKDAEEYTVYVSSLQKGVFLGRQGMNVATAAKLTGAKLNILPV